MSGVHGVGPVGPHLPLLQVWVQHGLVSATWVKPEPGDGPLLRGLVGDKGTLTGRFTNNTDLRDSKIQDAYELDPKGTAERLWDIYDPIIDANPGFTCWQLWNEPVFGNGAERPPKLLKLADFQHECLLQGKVRRQGLALFAFARGTPEPGDWPVFYDVWKEALQLNEDLSDDPKVFNLATFHQYGAWGRRGRGALLHDAMYHALRFEMWIRAGLPLPLKHAKYQVTEAGVDKPLGWREVYGESDQGRADMIDDWLDLHNWLAANAPGCLGYNLFTLHEEGGFPTFNFEHDPVARMLATVDYPPFKPAIVVPPAGGGGTTGGGGTPGGGGSTGGGSTPGGGSGGGQPAPDSLSVMLAQALGDRFVDVRDTLPRNQTKNPDGSLKYVFGRIDSRDFPYIAWHHTTGPRTYGPTQIANGHIANGWAGAGYNFCIQFGKLYYMGDVNTQRAHVWGMNHKALGAVFSGTYTTVLPATEDIEIARILVAVLDRFYGHQKSNVGHKTIALPGHGTACPGRIMEILPSLRTVVDAFRTCSFLDCDKGAWWLQEWTRRALVLARDEPANAAALRGAHEAINRIALPPIELARERKRRNQPGVNDAADVDDYAGISVPVLQKMVWLIEKAAESAGGEGYAGAQKLLTTVIRPPAAIARDRKAI